MQPLSSPAGSPATPEIARRRLLGLVLMALPLSLACHQVTSVTPNPAAPQQIVRIAGSGFGAQPQTGDQVTLDGQVLEVVAWADKEIQARLPYGKISGSYPLVVRRLNADSAPIQLAITPGNANFMANLSLTVNPKNHLSWFVEFDTAHPSTASATIASAAGTFAVPSQGIASTVGGSHHRVVILGLRVDTDHTVRVTADDGASSIDATVPIHPAPLPTDFQPPIQTLVSEPASMAPGYTMFPAHTGSDLNNPVGNIYIVDSAGKLVWYHVVQSKIDDVEYLSNGHVLYASHGTIIEIDMLGNEIRRYTAADIGVPALHHMVTELPNGNLVTLYPDMRVIGGYPGNVSYKVVADGIAEFTRDGHPVRLYPLWDYLDPYRIIDQLGWVIPVWPDIFGADSRTLTGANGVVYDPSDDSFLVSMRQQDIVLKVSRATGERKWVLGQDWAGSTGDDDWPYLTLVGPGLLPIHQHAPNLLPDGHLMLYDNGNSRQLPEFSRPVEYAIDGANLTVSEVWSWVDPAYDPPLFSIFTGDADRLGNGNVLVSDTGLWDDYPFGLRWIRFAEVRPADDHKVWEIQVRGIGVSWTGYNGKRIPTLYAGFAAAQ